MKNEDEPKEYFERNILLVVIIIGLGLFLDWYSLYLLGQVNPWGTATIIPGLILTLQGLWLLVHPYAIVYEDRFEIKQSLMYNKEFYYLDAKGVDEKKTSSLSLIYNDEEVEGIHLFGMRSSHKPLFKNKLTEKIALSVEKRLF